MTTVSRNLFRSWPAFTGFLEILCLTTGVLAGSFTFARLFDFPDWFPVVLLDIRTLGLIGFFAFWFYRRYRGVESFAVSITERWSFMSLAALGGLLIYMMIGNFFIWPVTADSSAFYPVIFTLLYALAVLICVNSIEKIFLVAKISIGVIAIIFLTAFAYGNFSVHSLSMLPVASPYFFSRAALIGFAFSLFLFRHEHLSNKAHYRAFLYAAIAAIFIAAGLLSYQRSTLIFYGVVGFLLLMVLAARRDYRTAGIMLTAILVGYAACMIATGKLLLARAVYHLPTHVSAKADIPSTYENAEEIGKDIVRCPANLTLANNALCGFDAKKIDECINYLKSIDTLDAKTKSNITAETCRSAVIVNDSDARLRMMHMSIKDTPSTFFGKGLNSFFFVQYDPREKRTTVYYYPHSIFFSVYHDTGLIGLGLLTAAVIAMLILGLRIIVLGPSSAIILLAIPLYYLLSSMVSGDIYDARFLWLIPLMIRNCIITDTSKHSPQTI